MIANNSSDKTAIKTSWRDSLSAICHPQVATMLLLGISAGIPLLLIFSSLSLWLREAGVDRSAVTYFSWAALGYSFKFVWAPLVDSLQLPFLTNYLGRRRAWLLLSQLMIIVAISLMALINPATGTLTAMALAAVLLGFSSATQDIVIDAYRIESAEGNLQALLSSSYIAGYRIGMLIAGAGALYLASFLGSSAEQYSYTAWRSTYFCMALMMLIGVITTFCISVLCGNYQQY
jgi:PAT family beta-lactamase induction signal transducer AmpG